MQAAPPNAQANAAVDALNAPGGVLTQMQATLNELLVSAKRIDARTQNTEIRTSNRYVLPTGGRVYPLVKRLCHDNGHNLVHPNFAGVVATMPKPAGTRNARLDALLGYHTNAAVHAEQLGAAPQFGPFGLPGGATQATLVNLTEDELVALRLYFAEDFGIVAADSLPSKVHKFIQWLQY